MATVTPVASTARSVTGRLRSWVGVLTTTLVIAWVSVQAFELRPGVGVDVDPESPADAEVARVVAAQEAAGLTCRTEPALTRTVVVRLDGAGVRVLPFDEAIAAMRSGTGRIAGYCF